MMQQIGPLNSRIHPRLQAKAVGPIHRGGLRQLRRYTLSLATIAGMIVGPGLVASVQADSNFGTVRITSSTGRTVEGYTAGAVPLFSILNAREDENNEPCIGYAERDPDHILQVSTSLSDVIIEVESNGGDTTLMIEAPDHTIYCSDDGNDSDAVITGHNWSAGEYRVWVGAFNAGQRHDYTLEIHQ